MRFKFIAFFLVVWITLSTAVTGFSQFKDYREATVTKSDGAIIVGKVNYKNNFHKRKKIHFKTSRSKEELSVPALKKIVFSSGEVLTVITVNDSTGEKALAKTLIDGSVSLHKAGDTYYLVKDTITYELDDKPITINRDGTEFNALSKKYLTALHTAFIDCRTLDYEPLSKGVQLKPLSNLIYEYGKCRDMPLRNVRRKPTIGFVLSAGPSGLKLNSSMSEGPMYSSGKGSSYSLSFLYDLSQSSRFKVRLDLNYMKADINGSFAGARTLIVPGYPNNTQEYVSFSTSFQGLRIPIGLQYYFFNNNAGLYISGGVMFSINKYEDWHTERYFVYKENTTKIYSPAPRESYEVTQEPIGGLWCAIGGDIRLNNALRLNIELKGIKTISNLYVDQKNQSAKIYEFTPSLGLNYKIR